MFQTAKWLSDLGCVFFERKIQKLTLWLAICFYLWSGQPQGNTGERCEKTRWVLLEKAFLSVAVKYQRCWNQMSSPPVKIRSFGPVHAVHLRTGECELQHMFYQCSSGKAKSLVYQSKCRQAMAMTLCLETLIMWLEGSVIHCQTKLKSEAHWRNVKYHMWIFVGYL